MVLLNYTLNAGILSEEFLACEWCPKLQLESMNYCRIVEAFGHTAIALNRLRYHAPRVVRISGCAFSCFHAESLHVRIWSGRNGTLLCATVVVLPLLKLTPHVPYKTVYYAYKPGIYGSVYEDKQWFKVRPIVPKS